MVIEHASVVARSVCCVIDSPHRPLDPNAYDEPTRDKTLIHPRQELIRHLPPYTLLPLLTIPFLAVRIQTRNRTGAEITRQPRRLQHAPSPPSAYERVARTPGSVAGVVDIPNNSEKAIRVRLAFVLGLGLERSALDFAVPFDEDPNGVQSDADGY